MKITFVGHSHINCIVRAHQQLSSDNTDVVIFAQLRNPKLFLNGLIVPGCETFNATDQEKVRQFVKQRTKDSSLTVLCPSGTEYVICSLTNNMVRGGEDKVFERITDQLQRTYWPWLKALAGYVSSAAVVIMPPPPVESEALIRANEGAWARAFALYGVAPAQIRLKAWLHQKRIIQEMAASCGLQFLELPETVFSETGFLREEFLVESDPAHANKAYGALILRHISAYAAGPGFAARQKVSSAAVAQPVNTPTAFSGDRQHPYVGLPDYAFWKQAVAQVSMHQFDPVDAVPFKIMRSDKVATAGSCFAQHISKRIRSGGFQFLVTEAPDASASDNADARGFYDFSARYGNIYTARQLVQLFDRAFGYFAPLDSYWQVAENRFCDPFRPRIEPDGFFSIQALLDDRQRHFAAVRDLFSRLDIFVFTLGLTECWVSLLDGAAYPIAPGVAGGQFDSSRYKFVNFGVDEIVSDLKSFIHKLRLVNPKARLILTVSPVPLAATYEPRNVLLSTTYSKSVLRVAAEMITHACEGVYYFPSYEIITGNYNRGRYFGPDLRSITQEGVDHVMSVFMRHLTETSESDTAAGAFASETEEVDEGLLEMMALAEAACDEELLERK